MAYKIYKISQDVNTDYDTYDEAIVIAESEDEARKIHPNGKYDYDESDRTYGDGVLESEYKDRTWSKKEYVKVEYLGEAKEGSEKGVVCSSFHAG